MLKNIHPVLIHLLALIIYTGLSYPFAINHDKILERTFFLALIITVHALIVLLYALVLFSQKQKQKGQQHLLAAALILIVGFSACLGTSPGLI